MAHKMPQDIQDMLYGLDNDEDINRIQQQWNEYAQANERYEQNYSLQFGNNVEGNLKFKEAKHIPTPAEQMEQFNDSIREEIYSLKADKHKEDIYYIEEEPSANDNNPGDHPTLIEDFQITGADASHIQEVNQQQELNALEQDRGINRDFKLVWDTAIPDADIIEESDKTNQLELGAEEPSDREKKFAEFKITFDTMDKKDTEPGVDIEVDKDDLEPED